MFSDEITDPIGSGNLMKPFAREKTPYEKEMDRRKKQAQADQQLRQYLSTLPPAARQEYLAGMEESPKPASPSKAQPSYRPFSQPQGDSMDQMAGMFMRNFMATPTAMAEDANDAIRREMDRRVAISREMRRMAHEKEMERMRQETEQKKIDAMLKRLAQQSGDSPLVIDIPR